MPRRILITGSVAYDLLLGYDGSFADAIDPATLDKLSVGFVTPRFVRHHGGCAANFAWTLRLLGGDPLLVGTVGEDGGSYALLLNQRGVDVSHLEQLQNRMTATAIIATDSSERQILFYHPGADAHGTWPDLAEDRDDIAYAIVSPRDVNLMIGGVDWCHAQKVPCLFDPGQQIHAFGVDDLRRTCSRATGVIVNEYEWGVLRERLAIDEQGMLALAPLLIITRAEAGLSLFVPGNRIDVPACKADRVANPTGAGDALRAGLLHGLSLDWDLIQAARLGAAMGSFVVEIEGTLLESLDMDVLRERVRNAYGEELPL